MTIEVGLRMASLAELQARTARGERLSEQEREAYLPSDADYGAVADWLRAEGFEVLPLKVTRLAVFARGSVEQIAKAFGVQFARVADGGAEFTSAITPPNIPAEFATTVLGVHGLQPHIRRQRLASTPAPMAAAAPYYPKQIAHAYAADTTTYTGRGETIAIIAGGFPSASDLTQFWSASGVSTSTARVTNVPVNGGPATTPDSNLLTEATLDVQWTGGLAPDANIRVYGFNENDQVGYDMVYEQVYADRATIPGMHEFSISIGAKESKLDHDYLLISAQYNALLANAGITPVASSGDDGNNGYDSVMYPASDPCVTAIGGTSITTDSSGAIVSETAWSGSGGGLSQVFHRPSWQVGAGLPGGASVTDGTTWRAVPDAAVVGDPNTGVAIVFQGKTLQVGGTSLSAPVWAAFCAIINQSRTSHGQPPLGLLNTRLYPLLGSTAMRDITSGSYGPLNNYDTYTGVGVPNIARLIGALGSDVAAPEVILQKRDPVVTVGQAATFAVAATGAPTLHYQWQRSQDATTWRDVVEDATHVGTQGPDFVLAGVGYGDNGSAFRCVITNSSGTITSTPAKLMVNDVGGTTVAGWPGRPGNVDGLASFARFSYPGSVRLDGAGNLFIADAGNNTIRKITRAGAVSTIAGLAGVAGNTDGIGTQARFSGPGGLAFDGSGNLFVTDSRNYVIRKITPDGTVTTFAGQAGSSGNTDGTGPAARFADPQNLATDSAGNVYVADGSGHTIRQITPAGVVTTIAGAPGVSGNVDGAGATARFNKPDAITVDASGNIYVADALNNLVRKITNGVVSTLPGTFNYPTGVAVATDGSVFVSSALNHAVYQISSAGAVTTVAGTPGYSGSSDGPAVMNPYGPVSLGYAQFDHPSDMTIDANGVLYVTDGYNDCVRRIVLGQLSGVSITQYPANKTVQVGQSVTFAISAGGSAPITYKWVRQVGGSTVELQDDAIYTGTHTSSLTVSPSDVSLDDAYYQCLVTNNFGTQVVYVNLAVVGPPLITGAAQNTYVRIGGTTTLTVPVRSTTGGTVQWYHDGVLISTRDLSSPLYIGPASTTDEGSYSAVVTNQYGQVTVPMGTVTLGSSRLINLSARAYVGTDANSLIVGCSIRGGSKSLLVRGVGPALVQAPFNLHTAVPDVTMSIYDHSNNLVGTVRSWDAALAPTMQRVGAFPFSAGSHDAAVVQSMPGGTFTTMVSATSTEGIGMAEFYDTEDDTSVAQLINLSARARAGTNDRVLIAGFVIAGNVPKKVLIRGVGPGLAQPPFSLSGVLPYMKLALFDSTGTQINGNLRWDGFDTSGQTATEMAAAFASVGAFPLPQNSYDTALIVTLSPGVYTAQIIGVPLADNPGTGIALVEIYDMDP
jgi:hypothetical protein